jgi:transcriptional antiterminator RfaH
MSKEWFVLKLKSNSHHIAIKNLNRQGFETFLPLHNITSQKASRFISNTQPLFPGYMFITFDRSENKWQKINSTYGVSRLITFSSKLKPLPTTFIDTLMKRYDSSGELLPIEKLQKGDQIKILKGPFANFIATIETYETNERIWILMNLMNRMTKIKTSSEYVQLLN